MASILRPFTLIAKGVRTFFKADLRVRRGAKGLEVVLDDPAAKGLAADANAKGKQKGKPDPALEQQRQELQRMQASLAQLLDGLPDNRKTLRHLAFIEHALEKKGRRALAKMPYDVLRRALDQFEGLVVNWSDEGLAALRSKMAVTLIEREPEAQGTPAAPAEGSPSVLESVALAHPVALEGEDAAEAEAALLAAYGAVALPGLELTDSPEPEGPAVQVQGELNSPSGKALAKAARRGADATPAGPSRQTETQA